MSGNPNACSEQTPLEQVIQARADRRGIRVDAARLRYANSCLYEMLSGPPPQTALYVGVGHGHDALLALTNGLVQGIVGVDPYIGSHGNDEQDYRDLLGLIEENRLSERFTVERSRIEDYLDDPAGPFDMILFNDVLHHIFVTEKRLGESDDFAAAVDLFGRLAEVAGAEGTMVVADVERHGLRPFLHNRHVLKGSMNYRTKQSWREWAKAATAGGWSLVRLCNYVPWQFRRQRRLWQGGLARRTLCDKYFAYFQLAR